MAKSSPMTGRMSMLLAAVGCLLFFLGIFGAPRVLAFAGVAVIVASLVGFFIEEQADRRREYGSK